MCFVNLIRAHDSVVVATFFSPPSVAAEEQSVLPADCRAVGIKAWISKNEDRRDLQYMESLIAACLKVDIVSRLDTKIWYDQGA